MVGTVVMTREALRHGRVVTCDPRNGYNRLMINLARKGKSFGFDRIK